MEDKCKECQGGCCSFTTQHILFNSEGPDGKVRLRMPEQLLCKDGSFPNMEFYGARRPSGQLAILFHCNHRTEIGRCGIYGNRPSMCRDWTCEALEGKVTVSTMNAIYGPVKTNGEQLWSELWTITGWVKRQALKAGGMI